MQGPQLGPGPASWMRLLCRCSGSCTEKGPVLSLVLCCPHLSGLSNFLTRGSIFLFCTGTHKYVAGPGCGCWPQHLHVAFPCILGFLTAWQLGSKFENHNVADFYSFRETFKSPLLGEALQSPPGFGHMPLRTLCSFPAALRFCGGYKVEEGRSLGLAHHCTSGVRHSTQHIVHPQLTLTY